MIKIFVLTIFIAIIILLFLVMVTFFIIFMKSVLNVSKIETFVIERGVGKTTIIIPNNDRPASSELKDRIRENTDIIIPAFSSNKDLINYMKAWENARVKG